LKVFATNAQNGTACAVSGIGFWQVACAEEQPRDLDDPVGSNVVGLVPGARTRALGSPPCWLRR
jgi:hypothetical protein